MCPWRGESSELLRYDDAGRYQDPRNLQAFMVFLQQHIAPLIGKELANLGLISREHSSANVAFITKLLVESSRASFEAVLKGLLLHGTANGSSES